MEIPLVKQPKLAQSHSTPQTSDKPSSYIADRHIIKQDPCAPTPPLVSNTPPHEHVPTFTPPQRLCGEYLTSASTLKAHPQAPRFL